MTKPRLVLHIGTHKTGTTSIQSFLRDRSAELLAAGVCYPPTDREPWPNLPKHCSVFSAAMRGDEKQAEQERQWLLHQGRQDGVHTLVVSEEGLSEPHPHLVEFFRPLAARFEVTVICFLRRPDLFVESLYNQFVREPARREGRSITGFARAKPVRERLRYATILKRWQSLPARVIALDFEAAARGGGLQACFNEAAGLPAWPTGQHVSNKSPDMRLAQVLARFNRNRLPYELAALIQADAALEREQRFPKLRHLLGRAERLTLLEELSPEMGELQRDFGIEFSQSFPDEAQAGGEDIDVAYLVELSARLSFQRAR